VLGEEEQPDWQFQGMIYDETLSQWLDRVHPTQYDTPDGAFARCPNCEEWSPCDVRTHVAEARADGAAEERKRIAAIYESKAALYSQGGPVRSTWANAARIARGDYP